MERIKYSTNKNKYTKLNMTKQTIWIEKYRPKTLKGVIGQEAIISRLKAYVKSGNLPHLLFSGPPGVGKTAAALCVARELYGENIHANFIELNASDERGINVVRDKIKTFARTTPLGEADFKIIFLDEADNLCLKKDTKIITGVPSGKTSTKIENVPTDKYIPIPSLNIKTGKIENDRGKLVISGNVEYFKVVLENGKKITASPNHPFFIKTKNGEIKKIKLKNLREGDKILDFEDEFNLLKQP